ncbi:unnamed protein product, partial [Symbiodinium necroappetens]
MLAVPSSSSSQALSLAWPPRKVCQGATICLQFYSGSSNSLPRDNTGRHAHQSTTTPRHALPDTFSNPAGTLLGGVDGLAAAVRKTPWRLSRDHREALQDRLKLSKEKLLESLTTHLGGSCPVAVGLMRSGDVLLGPALDLAQHRLSATQVLVANALLCGDAFEAIGCRERPRGGSVDLLRQLENFPEVKWFGGEEAPGSFEGLFAQRCAADARLVDVIGA